MNPQDEKYVEMFASLMIARIKEVDSNWKKPWFNPTVPFVKNVHGYLYTGINEILLRLISQEKEQPPVFLTFSQTKEIGCSVYKGKTAYPIIFYKNVYHTDEKLKEIAESKGVQVEELSPKDKVNYLLRRYSGVFNIDDTNLKEVKPELYDKIANSVKTSIEVRNIVDIPEIDKVLEEKSWICPINVKESMRAYFKHSIDNPHIVVPKKEQYPDQERFYSTIIHEMAHSTMIEHPRKELDYAHEELVAELSSAYAMSQLGVGLTIKDENAKYLKVWIRRISDNPEIIFDITKYVTKAIDTINRHINPDRTLIMENSQKVYDEYKESNKQERKKTSYTTRKQVNKNVKKSKGFKR